MTVAIEVRYPWGRVHANPWGHHTNEGATEWPPAPRRILRALYATWKTRCPDLDETVVHSLLDALTALPEYGTDEVRAGSTRHYLAADRHTSAAYDRDLALDAFLSCRPDRGVIVSWGCKLTAEQRSALEQLVSRVPFLGRADSICEMRISDEGTADRQVRWTPLGTSDEAEGQAAELLAASSPLDVDALVMTPAQVRSGKQLQPSSSRVVPYQGISLDAEPQARKPRRASAKPTAIRFLLEARSNPHSRESLSVAHLLRQAALKVGPDLSPTLSGRADSSTKRQDQHLHAHYLVFASDGHTLDTAVIWSPEGFDDDHVRGLTSLRSLRSQHIKEVPAMRTIVEAVGSVDLVAPELVSRALVWRSATPFVITRYPKDDRPLEEHVAEQVRAELDRRGHGSASIVVDDDPQWRRFRRHRPDGRSMRSARPARHVTIEFDQPVAGPMCLGALSHFSLGLFLPSELRE